MDPTSFRLEGSLDGKTWYVLNDKAARDYSTGKRAESCFEKKDMKDRIMSHV